MTVATAASPGAASSRSIVTNPTSCGPEQTATTPALSNRTPRIQPAPNNGLLRSRDRDVPPGVCRGRTEPLVQGMLDRGQ